MTQEINNRNDIDLAHFEHPAWDEPIICRLEVDLPGWLAQLTGQPDWEVFSEDEEDTCISFSMRTQHHPHRHNRAKSSAENASQAEVTLYHNGYAVVDVDGRALFDGSLTTATSDCARLSYYHVNGEPIALN